ncbi:hypothetical protein [Limnospira platensis]|uniref:hypothetical protein n=1 Tax=Limnospira platensis TaxID=118562 RepID=UPI003D6F2175
METKKMIQCEVEIADGRFEVVHRWAPINSDGKIRIFCEFYHGAYEHRDVPRIPNYENAWQDVPDTRDEFGSGFQVIKYLDLPASHSFFRGLVPSNVFFDDTEDDITFSQYHNL